MTLLCHSPCIARRVASWPMASASSSSSIASNPPWSHEGVADDALVASLSSSVDDIIRVLHQPPYMTLPVITSLYDAMCDTHSMDITYHSDELSDESSAISSSPSPPCGAGDIMLAIHKADGWWEADGIPLRAVLPSLIWTATDGQINVATIIGIIRDYAHSPADAPSSSSDSTPPWHLPVVPLTVLPRGYVHVQLTIPSPSPSVNSGMIDDTDLDHTNDLNRIVPLSSFTIALRSLLDKLQHQSS